VGGLAVAADIFGGAGIGLYRDEGENDRHQANGKSAQKYACGIMHNRLHQLDFPLASMKLSPSHYYRLAGSICLASIPAYAPRRL
jgi:hypothetical protein